MKIDEIKKRLKKAIKGQFFRNVNTITYIEAKEMINKNSRTILIDVRSIQEYNEYHLNGAICIPYFELQERISGIIEDKSRMIIVYCQSGARSKKAINVLNKMGYVNVYELERWN